MKNFLSWKTSGKPLLLLARRSLSLTSCTPLLQPELYLLQSPSLVLQSQGDQGGQQHPQPGEEGGEQEVGDGVHEPQGGSQAQWLQAED